MMNKKRRKINEKNCGILLVLTMLVGVMSGCVFGSKDNTGKDNTSNTTPAQTNDSGKQTGTTGDGGSSR